MAFVTGVYSLVLYSSIQHGCVRGLAYGARAGGVNSRFMLISWLLWVPLNLIRACLDIFCGNL